MPREVKDGTSRDHEDIVELLRNRPTLALELLQLALAGDLPDARGPIEVESIDFGDAKALERRADYVVSIGAIRIIVEVQMTPDERKRGSWPAYQAMSWTRSRRRTYLLVLAPDEAVARWAAKPIDTGHVLFVPIVVGPDAIPAITDPDEAVRAPELALLSLRAHRDEPLAVAIAMAALASLHRARESDAAVYYWDLIEHWLTPVARRKLEELMNMEHWRPRSEFGQECYGKGRAEGRTEGRAEGRTEGRAEGRTDLLLRLLELKFGPLDEATRDRVAHAESDQLDLWAEQLLDAKTLSDALR